MTSPRSRCCAGRRARCSAATPPPASSRSIRSARRRSSRARASASYGEYNTVTFDGGIGGAIVKDKVAVRVSGLYQHRDNWVDNTYTGASADGTKSGNNYLGGFNERDLRAQILLTPTEQLSILLEGQGRSYKGTSTIFHRGALIKGSNDPVGPRDQVALDEGVGNPQAYETYGTFANIAYDFGPVSLTSITAYETLSGYSRGDTDGGAAALFPVNGVPNGFGQSQGQVKRLGQVSQELRLASTGNPRFKYQFGAYYFDNRDITEFDQRAYPASAPTRTITSCCTTSTPAGRCSARRATACSTT